MSVAFALYLIGFILFLSIFSSGVIWGAMLADVPNLYITLGTLIIFGLGVGIFRLIDRAHGKAH